MKPRFFVAMSEPKLSVCLQAKQAEERRQKERQEREQVPPVISSSGQETKPVGKLGRALGQFIFSLVGLERILFANIVQRL